jgi:hypothetical protein
MRCNSAVTCATAVTRHSGERRAAACHGASVGHGDLLAVLPGGQRSPILEGEPAIFERVVSKA